MQGIRGDANPPHPNAKPPTPRTPHDHTLPHLSPLLHLFYPLSSGEHSERSVSPCVVYKLALLTDHWFAALVFCFLLFCNVRYIKIKQGQTLFYVYIMTEYIIYHVESRYLFPTTGQYNNSSKSPRITNLVKIS